MKSNSAEENSEDVTMDEFYGEEGGNGDAGGDGDGGVEIGGDAGGGGDKSSLSESLSDDQRPLSWAELVAQLLHDKQVANSLSNYGVQSFHLVRLVNEALEHAAKTLPQQKDLIGDLLTEELVLPDGDPEEEEVELVEDVYPPEISEEDRKTVNMVGRIFGPHGLVLLALEGVSGTKIKVLGKHVPVAQQKISATDEDMHLTVTARDTPLRARLRIDCVKRDVATLWTLAKPGEVDQVRSRQLRLQRILSGTYDPEDDIPFKEEDEKALREIYERQLDLPEATGEEHVTLTGTLPVPSEGNDRNWIGRILGPKGKTLQGLRDKTGCKMNLTGKGVSKTGENSARPLQLVIEAVDEPSRATLRLKKAIEEAKKLLVIPENPEDDPVKKEQEKVLEEEKKREERKRSLSRIPVAFNASKTPKINPFEGILGSPPAFLAGGGGLLGAGQPMGGAARPTGGPIRNAVSGKSHRFNPVHASGGPMIGGMGGAAMGGSAMDACKVFVYQIGGVATELDVYSLFGRYGAIVKVDVPRNKDKTSKGYAFVTFSDGESAARAVAALDGHRYEKNNYKPLQVSFKTVKNESGGGGAPLLATPHSSSPSSLLGVAASSPGRGPLLSGYSASPFGGRTSGRRDETLEGEYKLFVYNLGAEATEIDLYALCSPFGPVSYVNVQRDVKTETSKGFGFVTFSDYASALEAIQGLNGQPYSKNNYKPLQVSFKTTKSK